MKRFLIFAKAMLLMHLRNGSVLFWNFAFPMLLMVIYGVIMPKYMNFLTPGVIVLNSLSFGLVSSSTMMLEMREKGILRRLRATPLPALQLVGAYLVVNLALGFLQGALVLLAGAALYGVPFTAQGLALGLPMILIGMLTFLALGQVISGVAPKAGIATAAGMSVYFTLMFISDMIFPIDSLPGWLQKTVPYLPSYAVSQLVRSSLLDGALNSQWMMQMLLLAAYGLGAALLAARLFRWEPKA